MDFLFGRLTDWIKESLIEGIMSQFTGMYDQLNEQAGEIAGQVGQTPGDWNV
ncbi:MAG: hypothetical protein LBL15_05890 [Oscillospiraceae bacterium]|jgi:hypothetical protein|nr:hypothetical protein [Oscillospiraceae bacterium]